MYKRPKLESAEAAFLGVMARYFDLLDGLGLVEPGTALAALPQACLLYTSRCV